MSAEEQQGKGTFGLFWILANTFGWGLYLVVGGLAGWVVSELYDALGIPFRLDDVGRLLIMFAILGFCWGAIVGALQRAVLSRRFKLPRGWWVFATIVGLSLFIILRNLVPNLAIILGLPIHFYSICGGICYFLAPLPLGVAQWSILRRHFTRSGLWIPATAIALWLPTFARATFAVRYVSAFPFTYISFVVEGLFYGAVTLIALAVVTKQAKATVQNG